MEKRQQRFSIGYFILALTIILGLQTYFAAPTVETISYSEFKSLERMLMMALLMERMRAGERTWETERPDSERVATGWAWPKRFSLLELRT